MTFREMPPTGFDPSWFVPVSEITDVVRFKDIHQEGYSLLLGDCLTRMDAWKEAFAKSNTPIKLLIIGASKSRESYRPDWNHDSIEMMTSVSDDELFSLLSRSRGLIFPSLYEGFGFPMLEAMRCGCPVITSNIGAMAEIAGDAGLLVNPYSIESIAESIINLSESETLYAKLRKRGFRRQQYFTWEKTTNFYIDILLK